VSALELVGSAARVLGAPARPSSGLESVAPLDEVLRSALMSVPRSVALFLGIGILAASQSGNLVRLADAHPVAIAAWRLGIASALLAPIAGRRLGALRRLGRGEMGLLLLAALCLAAHFVAWIAAVQHTSVANAAVFFAVNPVITAIAAHLLYGERLTPRLGLSIVLGLVGVAAIGAADLELRREQLVGDALAVLCSLLFTCYFLLGKRLRRTLDSSVYVTALYGLASLMSFVALALLDLPVADYGPRTWLAFGLLALLPTMLGHTSFNHALRYMDAGRISTLTLSEPLFAGLVALFAWGEPLHGSSLLGYGFICLSVLVVVRERAQTEPASPVPGAIGAAGDASGAKVQ
jgi:drug/metabolite transporter (DMT)-like permease